MKAGEKYFVRVDKKLSDAQMDSTTREAHFQYLKELATITVMYAGGFEDRPGGMIIFRAENFDDAHLKCKGDPVIIKGFYGYELFEWNVLLTS